MSQEQKDELRRLLAHLADPAQDFSEEERFGYLVLFVEKCQRQAVREDRESNPR